MLFIVLDQLKQFAQLMIYKITIGSLASPESIATFGIAGLAKAAALTALVEIAIEAAKGVIRGKPKSKKPKADQFAEGKYDVIGANDGREYAAEYGGYSRTGFYNKPTLLRGLGLVGEGMTGPELVVDGRTVRNIRMVDPWIFERINQLRVPQHAEGNYPLAVQTPGPDYSELKESIDRANRNQELMAGIIKTLIDRGVRVNWDYNDSRNVNEQIGKLNRIKEDIG
jgi:hypothetical protein